MSKNHSKALEDKLKLWDEGKLMWEGKTQPALKLLYKDCQNGVFKIGGTILTELKLKYPPTVEAKQDLLLFGPINELCHCYFHEIDEIMIANST